MCITLMALSLGMVMAGSGDLDCLRIIRSLRFKIEDVTYGTHLGLGMALGFLFLGNYLIFKLFMFTNICLGHGRFSLKQSDSSIACLIMATTPRYPTRTADNTGHLQALRHLYLLAVEERICETVDLQTGMCVSVPVKVSIVF